ncbi:MAG: NADP-dependent phosphogluconate dehydrogenase, partial [Bacteroidota bacterium]|nr:NADP-dependent phosphogluconate dehydrogenase [Bacteroidota bacterium]
FMNSLQHPRIIILLVPAGPIVDGVIAEVVPLLDKGDIVIDGGNSHFEDTERRTAELAKGGYHFMGMGISGGEEGARHGPSMMPGGDGEAYKKVQPVLEAIAAKVSGEPCVTYVGSGASGHFVKMVHNGIEYAMMQLIAETYDILKKSLHLNDDAIHRVFNDWNKGPLKSYLLEITAEIFLFRNPTGDRLLLDDIKDEARSKGTGKWTSQAAMDLNVPVPTIDISVSMRDMSRYKSLRVKAAAAFPPGQDGSFTGTPEEYVAKLEQAFYFSMVVIYAQGMHLLDRASQAYSYNLRLDQIARIWRGGCIIRSSFLEVIRNAFRSDDHLEHLLLDRSVQSLIKKSSSAARAVVSDAALRGLPLPAYAASLNYYDTFRSERMPSNLIQAQRDFFGAHTYELIGREGSFHTEWSKDSEG